VSNLSEYKRITTEMLDHRDTGQSSDEDEERYTNKLDVLWHAMNTEEHREIRSWCVELMNRRKQ
jgi:hypothetical protein